MQPVIFLLVFFVIFKYIMKNINKFAYLLFAFPFLGTSSADSIGIDFDDVDQLDSYDYLGMNM